MERLRLALVLYWLRSPAKFNGLHATGRIALILWRNEADHRERILQITHFSFSALGMGLVAVWWERYHQGTRGALSC